MLACWIEDPNSEAFKLHIPRVYDYLWIAEDGMKMQVIIACSVLCGPFPIRQLLQQKIYQHIIFYYCLLMELANCFIWHLQPSELFPL
jgi:hypothetical protein